MSISQPGGWVNKAPLFMPEDDTKKGPDVEDEENEGTDEDVLDQGKADEDKTKTKLDNLDGALEEETRKVAEKEDELRRLREKRRTINETINREATETETSDEEAEGDDTEGKVVTTKLRDQIKHELRVEQQRDNFDSAKRKFYKTVIGKRYDPLNDPEGRLWKSLEDYLHLTDRDVAEERIIQKLVPRRWVISRTSTSGPTRSTGETSRSPAGRSTIEELARFSRADGAERKTRRRP